MILYYNDKCHIVETLNSVLSQTFLPEEIIIVDNGSTDGGLEGVDSNPLIRVIKLDRNYPLGLARNFGIDNVKTEFVAFLDSDDVWEINKIEVILPLLALETTHYIHSNFIRIDDSGVAISQGLKGGLEGYCSKDHFKLNEITIGPPSTIIGRTNTIRKVGCFESSFSVSADWDLNQRISREYPIIYCKETLVRYRIHLGNMSKNVELYYLEMNKAISENYIRFNVDKQEFRYARSKLNLIMAGEMWSRRDIKFLKYLIVSMRLNFRVFFQHFSVG
jgi:glycosyltransferase involved in cell wall biosynthesis